MSYFVIGVGGTGAKLMQTLVHLSAAGVLPKPERRLEGLLVDPDDANGNVDECTQLVSDYIACSRLQTGTSDLFSRKVSLDGPWTPIQDQRIDTLEKFFQYTENQRHDAVQSDMMDLLFSPEDRGMAIHQGFRGRPAIGSAVLNRAIDFDNANLPWGSLLTRAKSAGAFDTGVPLLVAGSVFGGSGAAGMPTILQLLREPFRQKVEKARLGLLLFLPYFSFQQVPNEAVQADPNAFALATAEALKYYEERKFEDLCDTIFVVGEKVPAEMSVSAVGSEKQRNEPHFVELIGGMAAVRFFEGLDTDADRHGVMIAARAKEETLTWQDLPTATGRHEEQMKKLQQMIQFAVAFHLNFYPKMQEELNRNRTRLPLLHQCITIENVKRETAQADLEAVDKYVVRFLRWLLRICTPRGVGGFVPGLVNTHVFAEQDSHGEWNLRSTFRKERDFRELFLNAAGQKQPDLDNIWKRANDMRVTDVNAKGTGRLLRAIYDSCTF